MSGRTARTLPYRAWGFFLGALRGDLGYLPKLLDGFAEAFRNSERDPDIYVPFVNGVAGDKLREAVKDYTENEAWRFGHLMANAVELTGRSNTREPPGPDKGVVSVAYFEDAPDKRYLGNGAVNWVLSSGFDVPFLVSPADADRESRENRGIVRTLRPMAAQSIRFFKAGARRWRVTFKEGDEAIREDWKLQLRVGSAPIVPGGPVAEGNKWAGLRVFENNRGEKKVGSIEVDSADFIDVDIMHVEANITAENATSVKDWAYMITAFR